MQNPFAHFAPPIRPCRTAVEPYRAEGVGGGKALDRMDRDFPARLQLLDRSIGAPCGYAIRGLAMKPVDLAQAEAEGSAF